MRSISSRKSDRVKELVKLHKKSERVSAGLFLAEGPAVVRMALDNSPELMVEVFAVENLVEEFLELGANVTVCTPEVIEALGTTVQPQGVIALCRIPQVDSAALLAKTGVLLVADGISDPGNMGTLIRTADATGVAGIMTFGSCVDPFNDKVVRSSAGSIFRVPISELTSLDLIPSGKHVYVLAAGASTSITDIDLGQANYMWVVGSEAHGVHAAWAERGDNTTAVSIPMSAGVESLNAGVAGSICLYQGYLQHV